MAVRDPAAIQRARKITLIGCLAPIVAFLVILGVVYILTKSGGEGKDDTRPLSVPVVKKDASMLPVLNVDMIFPDPPMTSAFIQAVALATAGIAEEAAASPAEGRSLTAVNFIVRSSNGTALLHYTIVGSDLLRIAEEHGDPAAYLLLVRGAGANDIKAKAAVRDYCQGTKIAFCTQVLQ